MSMVAIYLSGESSTIDVDSSFQGDGLFIDDENMETSGSACVGWLSHLEFKNFALKEVVKVDVSCGGNLKILVRKHWPKSVSSRRRR